MALASFGRDSAARNQAKAVDLFEGNLSRFEAAISVASDGTHSIASAFQFDSDANMCREFTEWFGEPRASAEPGNPRDQRLANAAQTALEKALLELCTVLKRESQSESLCLAGGVALNCAANGKLLASGLFSRVFVQPAAGDDGTALGNALLGWHSLSGRVPTSPSFRPYLGRQYDSHTVEMASREYADRVVLSRLGNSSLAIAESIALGKVVALFIGESEFGPRALGHRSILADARRSDMKDRLNQKVKHRESFRPFGPMVLEEKAAHYFAVHQPSPHMLFAVPIRQPSLTPAVAHVDNTARIQTVSRKQEPFLHDLLQAVGYLTGIPMVVNTSLNVAGEPIVESPREAIACLLKTGIDELFFDGIRISKRN